MPARPPIRTLLPLLMLAAALLPAACVTAPPGPMDKVAPEVQVGHSLAGNFLAGRHAQAARDMDAAAAFISAALEKDPDRDDLVRRAMVLYAAGGHMETAVAMARRLTALNPDAPIANIMVAVDDMRAGRNAEVRARVAKMSGRGINAFLSPMLMAWAHAGDGDVAAALKALDPLGSRDGTRALYAIQAALVNDLGGRPAEAEAAYRKAETGPVGLSYRLVTLLGNLLEREGKPDAARAVYTKYLAEHADSTLLAQAMGRLDSGQSPAPILTAAADGMAEGLFDIAGSLRQQRARESALIFGRMALHLRPDFPTMQMLVAELLESDDRLEAANLVMEGIDPLSPFSWTARMRVARNLDSLDRTDEAIARLEAMAGERPDTSEPLVEMGDLLRGHDRWKEAVTAYDRAFARIGEPSKRHWSLLYARGMSLERSKQWPRAEQDFLKALEFEPEQPLILNYLGYSWIEKGKNLDQAQEMIRKAVSLRPNDGYIVDSLGWVLYQLGDWDGAVRELERAVELRPEDPVINDHLGDAYWRVGRQNEARFQWRRVLTLEPEPDQVGKVKAKLDQGLAKDDGVRPGGAGS
ncbi:MAG: tetratricopeptide repeat protein [Hyphomicrobiales bacterium]|nr:tetratricopeptide repeat protein [Hyphomicrobiales bacterium]MCP5371795.1 tetratricopeptide repeat protein [Hyphomicrobiales bacterium]